MRDSNGFHATCLDTEPPIFYLNDVSRAVVRVVEGVNARVGRVCCAYTFDAGPNAVVYYEERDGGVVDGVFRKILGEGVEGWKGERSGDGETEGIEEGAMMVVREGVSRVILTRVGDGPQETDEHLVDERGEPVTVMVDA